MDTADPRVPPATRVPGIVVVRELVAHAEDAAVMLLEARGYSQGCLLEFMAVGRPASDWASPVLGVDFGSGVLRPGMEPSPPGLSPRRPRAAQSSTSSSSSSEQPSPTDTLRTARPTTVYPPVPLSVRWHQRMSSGWAHRLRASAMISTTDSCSV